MSVICYKESHVSNLKTQKLKILGKLGKSLVFILERLCQKTSFSLGYLRVKSCLLVPGFSSLLNPSLSGVAPPIPPERGAFPLDLEGKCKHLVLAYIDCIKKKGKCRELSREYLKCRMDNDLMVTDDFENLGFK